MRGNSLRRRRIACAGHHGPKHSAASAAGGQGASGSTAKPSGLNGGNCVPSHSATQALRDSACAAVCASAAADAARARVAGPAPAASARIVRSRARVKRPSRIGRVFRPAEAACRERDAQPPRCYAEQGAQEPNRGRFTDRGHSGEPGAAAPAQLPHDDSLGLVGSMVPEQQVDDAGLAAGGLQRRQPGVACSRGQAWSRPERVEREHLRRDAEARELCGGVGRLRPRIYP